MTSLGNSVVGAVLAGGQSRRFGQDKALLSWSGRALLLRPFEILQAVFSKVVVVTVSGRAYEDLGVPVIHDRFEGQGPLAGIHAALEWAGSRPVFVTACDLPNISAELVDHVAGLGGRSPAVGSQNKEPKAHPKARVAVWNSRQQPLFGLYSESCREPIAARLHDGRLEAWRFLAEIDTTPVPITPELELYRPDLLLNVNSRADLQPRTPERAREPSRQR